MLFLSLSVMMEQNQIIIYQTSNGETVIDVEIKNDTVWLTQAQMVKLFERDQSVISRHIQNVFKKNELDEKNNMQNMHIANSAGYRLVFLFFMSFSRVFTSATSCLRPETFLFFTKSARPI